ncbi:transposase [Streptomyces sp. ME18-1-4]|uniref:transposase n=1 Tax=Streptomyces sp. ME18-1-4 TaxID=3028685 RepID=UPI0029B9FEA9|nr:transposase [Streptomyces sp. ME18-1-4]MDX3240279.1 transposase [Streptomyces sp. ME18-1-4]
MGDNPDRLNTEASLAALCGVSPIEYSSGRRSTRRLNHGGDRQANAALHRISSPACATTCAPRRTTNAAPRKARLDAKSSDASAICRPRGVQPGQTGCPRPRVIGASVIACDSR